MQDKMLQIRGKFFLAESQGNFKFEAGRHLNSRIGKGHRNAHGLSWFLTLPCIFREGF